MPDHKLHLVQHNFLREHDQKTKRLWFLWGTNNSNAEISRCGCIGGCAFFGGNRNGLKFFKPSAQDVQDNYNVARFHILNNPKEYGFGESILHEGQLVFHTPPYSLQPVFLQEPHEYGRKFQRNISDNKNVPYPKNDSIKEHCEYSGSSNKNKINQKTDMSHRKKP